jgi:hypothetical protein
MRSWYPPFAKNAKNGAPHCVGNASEIKAWATRHFRLQPFAKNAKELGTHCVGNARKIKSPGHPAECL